MSELHARNTNTPVREKSGNCQGNLLCSYCGHPVVCGRELTMAWPRGL